jgi:chemotaxis protein methyltransferase CheR
MGGYYLGVSEVRMITGKLEEKGYPDFSEFAFTSLRRRLDRIMTKYRLPGAGELVTRISDNDNSFTDTLIDDLCVETTELFRDPSLWRLLRDSYFPAVLTKNDSVRILIPGAASSEDLISLMILLTEAGWTDRFQVSLSSLSEKTLAKIRKGVLDTRKMEVNEANYKRFQGKGNLTDYFSEENQNMLWHRHLSGNINYLLQRSHLDDHRQKYDFILFMDKQIYFNPVLSNKVLEIMYNNIRIGGYLVVGSGESLVYSISGKNFIQADPNEKIYRKLR